LEDEVARTIIDITAMAEALGTTAKELLEDWQIQKGGQRVQTAIRIASLGSRNTLYHLLKFGYLAAHFVRNE
jgi:hypothetical protein